VAVAAFAGQPLLSVAQQRVGREKAPYAIAVRDVIKPNPHDGALAAPVLSYNWWNRMSFGPQRAFQRTGQGVMDSGDRGVFTQSTE
jgi:hypothetical protein